MSPFIAELLGTALLVLFGNGVVANVVLARTKGHGAGWIVITFGWGMAVFIAVFCTAEFSGAHLNPAITIALAAANKFDPKKFADWNAVPIFICAQMLGGFIGACIVYLFHVPYFDATDDRDAKLACFCTAPNIRSMPNAFFCETVGTFALVLPLFLMIQPSIVLDLSAPSVRGTALGLGAIGALPVGLLILAIGLSLGGTTGYAINPARDLAPRLAHFVLPIKNKRDSDWSYAWIPVVAPIVGGLLAALAARALQR
jgi:glycerol uptake facilitator protein